MNLKTIIIFFFLLSNLIFLVLGKEQKQYKSGLKKEDFQKEIDGKKTDLYVLTNKNGYEISITNYGGTIAAIMAPDKQGKFLNVVHGHDSIENILNSPKKHLSTLIGRYANRINNGKFILDGKEYQLKKNDKNHHIHGGPTGFHVRVWDTVQISDNEVRFYYESKDGEENYPGTLNMQVTFILNDNNEFKILYNGKCDKKTIINMTHHIFVNLEGLTDPCPTIENHLLTLNAKFFIPIDDTQMPTGEIKSVEGTPFDFLTPRRIGERINDDDPYLKIGNGYNHCLVINKKNYGELAFVGKLVAPKSGRNLEIYTTEPGFQLYTANSHNGFKAYHGVRLPKRSGITFEVEHFPNSPNIGFFPSVILKPGDIYKQETIFKFGVEK